MPVFFPSIRRTCCSIQMASVEKPVEEKIARSAQHEAAWDLFKRMGGAPCLGVAPMVDASELPFRMLCRKYGATMAWTPMLHSRMFVEQKKYRKKNLTTCAEDRPLAIQFCANDPEILLQAALLVQDQCDAIDINLGCPQNIARRGNYGAFLGEQWDIVKSLVEKLAQNLSIPVICKIRILDSRERTLQYAKMIEDAGASILTVHGRTKEQKGHTQGLADLKMVREIKQSLSIPVISNGNVRTYEEAMEALRISGCDGVMSACGLLVNPALFSGKEISPQQITLEYLDMCEKYPVEFHMIRGHLHKLLNGMFRVHTDLREVLNRTRSVEDCRKLLDVLNERLSQDSVAIQEQIEEVVSTNKQKRAEELQSAASQSVSFGVLADDTTKSVE